MAVGSDTNNKKVELVLAKQRSLRIPSDYKNIRR